MKTQSFMRGLANKLSIAIAVLLLMFTGCQQEDEEALATDLATDLAIGAISVAGDFIRALLAAFLF